MSDRELLELAAKAAGMPTRDDYSESHGLYAVARGADGYDGWRYWNPLTDDGDALRLAAGLGLNIIQQATLRGPEPVAAACGFCGEDYRLTSTYYNGDPLAATRRAIVRAAAEIGRAMP